MSLQATEFFYVLSRIILKICLSFVYIELAGDFARSG